MKALLLSKSKTTDLLSSKHLWRQPGGQSGSRIPNFKRPAAGENQLLGEDWRASGLWEGEITGLCLQNYWTNRKWASKGGGYPRVVMGPPDRTILLEVNINLPPKRTTQIFKNGCIPNPPKMCFCRLFSWPHQCSQKRKLGEQAQESRRGCLGKVREDQKTKRDFERNVLDSFLWCCFFGWKKQSKQEKNKKGRKQRKKDWGNHSKKGRKEGKKEIKQERKKERGGNREGQTLKNKKPTVRSGENSWEFAKGGGRGWESWPLSRFCFAPVLKGF